MTTPPEMDTARIARTMQVVDYEEHKPKIKRFIEARLDDPEGEPMVPTEWDLYFEEYLEEHKNSKLLFCCIHRQSESFSVPRITMVSGQDG
jgi:hypothetical protein